MTTEHDPALTRQPDTRMATGPSSAVSAALRHIEAQATLFSPVVSRLALLECPVTADEPRQVRINVWRNHGIESLLALAQPYFAFQGWHTESRLSGYDDSFLFADRQATEIELIWMDSSRLLSRLPPVAYIDWLGSRLRALRDISSAPIILASWFPESLDRNLLRSMVASVPAVRLADMGETCAAAGVPLEDPRLEKMSGSRVGGPAQIVLARELACHWLPGTLSPPIKAVAVDLDHTLHQGVLGEDGVGGVVLTEGHASLQHHLKSLANKGIFLALISRNEPADVEALFHHRSDYPLRLEDFTVTEIGWGSKADALARVAHALNIAPDAILFVDDNPGELTAIAQQLPATPLVAAWPDASLTLQAIRYYPGLWRWPGGRDEGKRLDDLKANSARLTLAGLTADPAEYFRGLAVELTLHRNPREQLSRLADLCQKTNQFNLALRRYNEAEIAERMGRPEACVISAGLCDRLSDSGIVAVIIAERQDDRLVVEELCISCRALGRRLENAIVFQGLLHMPIIAACRDVVFRTSHGPRNGPALEWLARALGIDHLPPAGNHGLPLDRLSLLADTAGIRLIIKD